MSGTSPENFLYITAGAGPKERAMPENNHDPEQDKIEEFEVSNGRQPGTYEIYIKTRSEEFDFLIDGGSLQKFGDAIYAAIDRNEGKQ